MQPITKPKSKEGKMKDSNRRCYFKKIDYEPVTVWAGILITPKAELLSFKEELHTYIREILQIRVIPFFFDKPNCTLMHDNAPTNRYQARIQIFHIC